MTDLPILQHPEVAARTSIATRRVLEERAEPLPHTPFLSPGHMAMLRVLVDTILPQATAGTHVDIAESIDRRLDAGQNAGFRYAVLPPDGEAYRQGLTTFVHMLEHTTMQAFDQMPRTAREDYLRYACNGDVDGPAHFPLSTWLRLLRTDVVRFWVAHPDTMRSMGYFGFANGATGNQGWRSVGPDSAAPFEQGHPGDVAAAPMQHGGAR